MKIRNLMVSLMVIVTICLLCTKFSYAEPVANAVDTASNNPFKIIANEIISFSVNTNVGVAGYVSGESKQFVPCLAVQIGTSKHGWFNYGFTTNVSTEDGEQNLNGIGIYGGVNGIKVAEKIIKKDITDKASCTIGWAEMYYLTATDNNSKGWDSGLFGAIAVVKF